MSAVPDKMFIFTTITMSNDDQFVQHARLKILEQAFYRNKYAAVKSLLGTDCHIHEIALMNYFIEGYVVVDVTYSALKFNPLQLYYVKKDSLKLLDVNQKNKYIVEINEIPVSVTVLDRLKNMDILPIRVFKTLNKSNNDLYSYYGKVYTIPTNEYCSIISFPEYNLLNKPAVTGKLTDELNPSKRPKFSEEEQLAEYQSVIAKLSYNSTINTIIRAKSSDEIKSRHDTGFIIDVNEIAPNTRGILYCISKRNIFDVLVIPDSNCIITEDVLETLKSFMYHEYVEYKRFYETVG